MRAAPYDRRSIDRGGPSRQRHERGHDMNSWNPWKLTTIGLLLVIATALITGLVVANRTGSSDSDKSAKTEPAPAPVAAVQPAPAPPPVAAAAPQPPAPPRPAAAARP